MIEVSFGGSRSAAITNAYQYDTGQRLRLSGLPSPEELAEEDDFLSGDVVTVQAQFGYAGDSQTDPRLAEWDEDRYAWMVNIPDAYLTRHEAVHVYVYVSYGSDENGTRNKTCYDGVFTPISRPAPNTTVTDDQLDAWEDMEIEVDLALTSAQTAIANAQTMADNADEAADEAAQASTEALEAAQEAVDAADRLAAIGTQWGGLTVRTAALAAGSSATATLEGDVLTIGSPAGAKGAKGDTGDTGPSDITLAFANGVLTITPK